MSYSTLPISEKPVDELRRILTTSDGLGSKIKSQCLDELIKRVLMKEYNIHEVNANEDLSRRHS